MTIHEHKIQLKYQIGDKIKSESHIYTVAGFEYVKDRGTRYILLYIDGNKVNYEYLYDYEIKYIKK